MLFIPSLLEFSSILAVGQSNQGNILNWQEDDFVSACELAIKRVQANKVNEAGLKLQEDFSEKKSLDRLLEIVQ